MSLNAVLENWSDYDKRKKNIPDANQFDCSQEWEVDYLVVKIKAAFPYLNELAVSMAIKHECTVNKGVYPRKLFVESVLRRLGVIRL